MNALQERLGAAVEADALRFTGDDFAGRFGSVRGRIARRRAARSAGIGGVSVLGVGVLSVGASQVPWNGLVFGTPASSPGVVCTTSTPDVVAGSDFIVPDGAEFLVRDNATGEAVFVGSDASDQNRVWTLRGTGVELASTGFDTFYAFKSGATFTVANAPDSWPIERSDGDALTVVPVEVLPRETASAVSVISADGTVVGKSLRLSDGTHLLLADGALYTLSQADGLSYSYVDGTGERATVTLVDNDPAGGAIEPSPSAVVTCVTTSPEPSGSPSSATTPSPSLPPTQEGSSDPSWADAVSPFQCGFEFDGDTDSDPLAEIRDARWVTAEAAEAAVRAFFQDPDSVELNLSGDLVPVVTYDLGAGPQADVASGEIGPRDPRGGPGGFASTDGVEDTARFAVGAAYVLAQDGVVVATYMPSGGAMSQYIDSVEPDSGTLRGLNVADAFETCSGADPAALGTTDLYAVAGWYFEDEQGVDGPRYAWLKVAPQS